MKKTLTIATSLVVGINVGMYMQPWLPKFTRRMDAYADAMYLKRRKREMEDFPEED